MRLNVGCGPVVPREWVNIDVRPYSTWPGGPDSDREQRPIAYRLSGYVEPVDGDTFCCDVARGLPFADGIFDGAVCHHVLQMIPQSSVVDFLAEIARVVQQDSYLRLSVPSLHRALHAYNHDDREFFPNAGDTIDEALCVYLSQNGATRSFFTPRVLFDSLARAGFGWSEIVEYGRSRYGLAELDSREHESLLVEARR